MARVFPRIKLSKSWSWGCIYILFLSVFSNLHCLVFFYFFLFWLPLIPNKHVFFSFCPPPISSISRYLYADPLHCNMTYLFLSLLKDDLREYTYAARLAGLVYGIASGMNAILVSKPFEVWREVGGASEGSTLRLWQSVEMAWFSTLHLIKWCAVCPVCPIWRIIGSLSLLL